MIMAIGKPINSCKSLLKKLGILIFPSDYIFSLINFTGNNLELFQTNPTIHGVTTMSKIYDTIKKIPKYIHLSFC